MLSCIYLQGPGAASSLAHLADHVSTLRMNDHDFFRSPTRSGRQETEIMGPAGANQHILAQFFSVLLA
jgi:hypothetical protein